MACRKKSSWTYKLPRIEICRTENIFQRILDTVPNHRSPTIPSSIYTLIYSGSKGTNKKHLSIVLFCHRDKNNAPEAYNICHINQNNGRLKIAKDYLDETSSL